MWSIFLKVLSIAAAIFRVFRKLTGSSRTKEQIEADKRLADAIRSGDGRRVAEEWKRRKYYS